MIDFAQARTNMVDGQIHPAGVVDTTLLNAFENTPRELFVPERLQHVAYTDENIDIGQGRYILEPIVHAKLLQAANVKSSDVALDIGCGAGYSSAILSCAASTVIAIENNKRQLDKAQRLWEKLDMRNIVLVEGDLVEGHAKNAPYDVICINGAVMDVPQKLLEQLNIGGRLITVVKARNEVVGKAMLFMRGTSGYISSQPLFDAGVPFLDGFVSEPAFTF